MSRAPALRLVLSFHHCDQNRLRSFLLLTYLPTGITLKDKKRFYQLPICHQASSRPCHPQDLGLFLGILLSSHKDNCLHWHSQPTHKVTMVLGTTEQHSARELLK